MKKRKRFPCEALKTNIYKIVEKNRKTIMGRIESRPRPEIYYFEKEPFGESKGCLQLSALKNFLYFLKRQKVSNPIKFSFIDCEGTLLPSLNLIDNISLDCISVNVSSVKNFTLEDYLERNTNNEVLNLYKKIHLPNELPYNVDSRTRKIAALVKGLLQKSEYLFLDCPEKYLEEETLKLFANALVKILAKNNQTLLIYSKQPEVFMPYVTNMVKEKTCLKTGKSLYQLTNSLTLSDIDKKETDGTMIFHMPENITSQLKRDKKSKKSAA